MNSIHITHQDLANEIGTAREVVSRLLKQLEKEWYCFSCEKKEKPLQRSGRTFSNP